jgi:hypothetical protein
MKLVDASSPPTDDKRSARRRMGLAVALAFAVHGVLIAALYFGQPVWRPDDNPQPVTFASWNPEWDSPLDAVAAAKPNDESIASALLRAILVCVAAIAVVLVGCAFLIGVLSVIYGAVAAVFETVSWVVRRTRQPERQTMRRPSENKAEPARTSGLQRAEAAAESILRAFRAGNLPEPLSLDFIDPDGFKLREFTDNLPAIEVARHWGIEVQVFKAEGTDQLGQYCVSRIDLGVKNLSTWAHELTHAADHRRAGLSCRKGPQLDDEVVAELGGAILLEALNDKREADRGGAWKMVQHICARDKVDPTSVCCALRNRACNAAALVIDMAERLNPSPLAAAARRAAKRRDRLHAVAGVLAITALWSVGMLLLSLVVS